MKLEDYAEELKDIFQAVKAGKLPVEDLRARLGIYDNWPILLNANINDFPNRLKAITGYKIGKNKLTDSDKKYSRSEVVIRMVKPHNTSEFNEFMSKEESQIHIENQKRSYNIELLLLDGVVKETTAVSMIRNIAEVVTGIVPHIPKLAYAACLPYAKDVVYYPDFVAEEIDAKKGSKR